MLDFLIISVSDLKKDGIEIKPKFRVTRSKDLMIKGGDFYAVYNEVTGFWTTDQDDLIRMIDKELQKKELEVRQTTSKNIIVRWMWDSDSGSIDRWLKYCQKQMRDNYHTLDSKIAFANDEITKELYVTKQLPYALEEGNMDNWSELMNVLYAKSELDKIRWFIGAIATGDSRWIQKFVVLYGASGTGKSTLINIIQEMFDGYWGVFNAKAIGSGKDAFALETLKANPLIAIEHDGDLSKIEDNTRFNSLTAHETITVNEKHKSLYSMRFESFLIIGTNKPVKITDAKSGIIRRLIDISPTGNIVSFNQYTRLMDGIRFEYGHIIYDCVEYYKANKEVYNHYVPMHMIDATNDFYNFIADNYTYFNGSKTVTLTDAWGLYKFWVEDSRVAYVLNKRVFKDELKNYFEDFQDRYAGEYNVYINFISEKFVRTVVDENAIPEVNDKWLVMKKRTSLFDKEFADMPAQKEITFKDGSFGLGRKWANNKRKLRDIDTREVHYVKVPSNLIVVDFDIKDENGNKDKDLNLEAANKWPKTYAEFSKSGAGIHLHYLYHGDVSKLANHYSKDVEIKVFTGDASLRRKLTLCNDIPIATISSGLPLKEVDTMINWEGIKTEVGLRKFIAKCLNKEHHGATAPEMDFIYSTVENAYNSGLVYDISDLHSTILAFAMQSTNQSDKCVKLVSKMHFTSDKENSVVPSTSGSNDDLYFYDIESFPNLFVVAYMKYTDSKPTYFINPSRNDIAFLLKKNLIGFNNRSYDNHMIYARIVAGYTIEELYSLSKKIIGNQANCKFREAYNISYTDIYDYSSKKQSLKKWEIELGITHLENHYDWDQPVPEDKWVEIAEYCANDVMATKAVFDATSDDFLARKILVTAANKLCPSVVSTENDTTNTLTTRIIFRGVKDTKSDLVYTDLSVEFPGYSYERGADGKFHNMYMGEDVGKGGYVFSNPGQYTNVALLDIASMHPHSIKALNLFGKYTKNFTDLMDARIYVKHKDIQKAKSVMDGALADYIPDDLTDADAKNISTALKIAINSVYGLTSASFDNPFKDPRNVNNIVALRGALFMVTLKHKVQELKYQIAHIKTDSIKIPNADDFIIKYIQDFGEKYGYSFEHEATFSKYCLVNDAVYVCKVKEGKENGAGPGEWSATGTQFKIPYTFKKLFSKEPILFDDLCVTKSVKEGTLYLDKNESLPEGEHDYRFVGKVGRFSPIKPGCGGGELYRIKDGKYYAAPGTKGYRWLESSTIANGQANDIIDMRYFDELADEAIAEIDKYGDFYSFISDDAPLEINSNIETF